ncbi:MAG: glutathione S-transferase C-terminal domain-containing protein [Planctomycetes bacterium]|nr:glutathione S-transferase C-terminal domain-containing protein [Planctomycetota bacterium]MCB9906078.1 glutathione S-transferase C-terminal domain-containing protein [Planctomycetota bacterium]
MKLYYKAGACSQAVNITLRELGLDFALDAVDRKTGLTSGGVVFKTIHPAGYVPALELDGGELLTEGVAIQQHLADTHPESGLAPKPATIERAHFNAFLNWLASELHKSYSPFFKQQLEGAARDFAVENLHARMDLLEERLGDGRAYTCGDAFTIADSYAFVITGWAERLGFGLDRWPRIAAFRARMLERPAVRAALRSEGLLEDATSA